MFLETQTLLMRLHKTSVQDSIGGLETIFNVTLVRIRIDEQHFSDKIDIHSSKIKLRYVGL